MFRLIPIIIFLISLLFLGCKEDSNPIIPDTQLVFNDTIPFNLFDTGLICFERISADGIKSGVCIIDINNHKTRAISGLILTPVISHDGNKIAYSGSTGDYKLLYDIFIMNSDGSGNSNISNVNGNDSYPSWSADSKNIFYLNFYGNATTLYERNKNIIYQTSHGPQTPFSLFEPKGMVFYNGVTGANPVIYLLNTATGSISTLCSAIGNGDLYTPRWSPDGNQVVFVQVKKQTINNETTDIGGIIQVYNFTSGVVNIIYEWSCDKHINWIGGNELSVCWSPDGTKLLFNRTGNGLESHIFIVNNDGSELKQITNEPGVCDRSVSWSKQ